MGRVPERVEAGSGPHWGRGMTPPASRQSPTGFPWRRFSRRMGLGTLRRETGAGGEYGRLGKVTIETWHGIGRLLACYTDSRCLLA